MISLLICFFVFCFIDLMWSLGALPDGESPAFINGIVNFEYLITFAFNFNLFINQMKEVEVMFSLGKFKN